MYEWMVAMLNVCEVEVVVACLGTKDCDRWLCIDEWEEVTFVGVVDTNYVGFDP